MGTETSGFAAKGKGSLIVLGLFPKGKVQRLPLKPSVAAVRLHVQARRLTHISAGEWAEFFCSHI